MLGKHWVILLIHVIKACNLFNSTSIIFSAIDELLPRAILNSFQAMLDITGAIIVATTVNPYFLIPVAIMAIIFIFVLKIYLRTSMNVKRLEGMGKKLTKIIQWPKKYGFSFCIGNFSQITSVHAFVSHIEWPVNHSCLQSWKDPRRRIRLSPRYTYGMSVPVNLRKRGFRFYFGCHV